MSRLIITVFICLFLQACSAEKEPNYNLLDSSNTPLEYADDKRESTKYLAYEHTVGAKVELEKLAPLHNALVDQCISDSQFQCVVLEANLQSSGYSVSTLRLRMLPGGVNNYLQMLDQQGKIQSRSSKADDLTDAVIDNNKRVAMLIKHQQRLEELSAKETGDIEALLKIANELAKVQTDLEFARGKEQQLAKRINTDLLNISLTSDAREATSRWEVVSDAFGDFGDDIAYATASVISFTASILPWLPVMLLSVWALRFLWRFFRRKKT